ncbi:MAG: ATPase, partial [Deltaproteobacteria bacterium]|nr:ATPase [Deltaproteobacteria bacterium]
MSKKTQQTIKTKGRLQRGSEWQKWDLHVHSPKVFLNNQYGNASAEDFVNKLVDSKITAVGLTNYFRFDDEELGDIKDKLTAKGITVFPNIEFRTQPPNKENEEMHVHVLFSNDVSSQKIKNFLGRLKTVDGKYCKDLTIEDIKTTTVSIDTLKNTLAEDEDIKHLEDYLIVACPRGQGNFRPSGEDDGRGSNFAVVIDKYSDVLFGNANDTEFFLKQDRYENAKPKPVVLCSDAHKLDDIGKKFSWIKSETTFEGLKQILYDPRSRVAIQDNKPVQPNNVISSITFNISPDAKITVKQKD